MNLHVFKMCHIHVSPEGKHAHLKHRHSGLKTFEHAMEINSVENEILS